MRRFEKDRSGTLTPIGTSPWADGAHLGPAAERKWTNKSGGHFGMTLTFFVLFRRTVIAAFLLSQAGCAGTTIESLRDPVPEQFQSSTVVPGYSRIRYWGDDPNGIPSDNSFSDCSSTSFFRERLIPSEATYLSRAGAAMVPLGPECFSVGRTQASARSSP